MSKGHIATLVPMSSERAKAIAARERFTPARMYRAIHKRLKNEPDLKARIVDAVLENACDRDSRWHGPAVELVLRGDPDLRAAINADARADLALSAPRIVIVGPGAVATDAAATPCIDIDASVQRNRPYQKLDADVESEQGLTATDADYEVRENASHTTPSGGELAALQAQVAALTALVAQLASVVAGQVASRPGQATINAPLPRSTTW